MTGAAADADARRAEILANWEQSASGWGARADRLRQMAMPVSAWMIDALEPQPGQRVLELAAGPGDTGFLAAELIQPGGTLICSDASDAMLDVARDRAAALQIDNVEFMNLQLEWIDLETASVDAVLCRWGVMLALDQAAAMREIRRVLRPGGNFSMAVWDVPDVNPWHTVGGRALVELELVPPPDRSAPGPFALSAPGLLEERLHDAGFTDVRVEAVPLNQSYPSLAEYVSELRDISRSFRIATESLSDSRQADLVVRIEELAAPYVAPDGSLTLPAQTLAAAAAA
jgi:SAM-dependent methyltransferase